MDKKYVINIPKDNVNDEECKLIELSFNNGDEVKKGDSLAIFETSKATFDIEASRDGYFYTIAKIDEILKFYELTECPMLVNTSFNVRGEPIVCTPQDAIRCFMNTNLDVLVIENFLILTN